MSIVDFNRIDLIQNSSIADLENREYLENLILRLGMNDEEPQEQPSIVLENAGGLKIWQYPNQFSKYILKAKELNVRSYLEIGCRWGGTFVLTAEYLKKTCGLKTAVAIDIIESPVKEYCDKNEGFEFLQIDSQDPEFAKYLQNKHFDMVLIDGFHSFEAVTNDYNACKDSVDIFVFHDITSDVCPEVEQYWNEFKKSPDFEYYEFKDQYKEVFAKTNQRFLGIGMAVKKSRISCNKTS